jgi:hypothetical protein
MEAKIKNFLSGCGSGNGGEYISGYTNGDVSGDGSGSGSGRGYISGNGYGNGYGSGDGNTDGSGNGEGKGSGNGGKLVRFQGRSVYYINSIPCVFESVHETWAVVNIIDNDDFTTEKAFIAKFDGYFAHGKTIKDAFAAVTEKAVDSLSFEEKKKNFLKMFPSMVAEYSTMDFYTWHHILTSSCEYGRKSFVKQKGIDLEGTMTVKRFIELTCGSYNGNKIKELESMYKN